MPTVKATSALVPGDQVQVNSRIVRTVARVAPNGYLNRNDEPLVNVYWHEGRTADWSDGNSATWDTEWDVVQAAPDRIVPADAARAVGRFRPEGPVGYQASNDPAAPVRPTRGEAVQDWLAKLNLAGDCDWCGEPGDVDDPIEDTSDGPLHQGCEYSLKHGATVRGRWLDS